MGNEDGIKEFGTGAKRGAKTALQRPGGRYPRFDLISPIGLRRLAETYSEGADKRGEDNWRHGMHGRDLLNRSIAHIYARLLGDTSDDHIAHAAWGLIAFLEQEELRPELNVLWQMPEEQRKRYDALMTELSELVEIPVLNSPIKRAKKRTR